MLARVGEFRGGDMKPASLAGLPLFVALAVGALGAATCRQSAAPSRDPVPGRSSIGSLEIVEDDTPPADLMKVKRADLARYLDAIYRLKPDRRFVYAVSELRRLGGGRQEQAHVTHLDSGGWSIRLGTSDVGRLPEIPVFADGLSLVRTTAALEARGLTATNRRPPDPAELKRLEAEIWHDSSERLVGVLVRLNELAADHGLDPSLMRLAGEALLAIHVETIDSAGVLDPLLGRAMALLALSEQTGGETIAARSLSVLAWQLGYSEEAKDLASGLPPDDTWCFLLQRNAAVLAQRAASSKDPFVIRLALLAAIGRRDRDAVFEIGRAAGIVDPPTPLFAAAALELADFSLAEGAAGFLSVQAFRRATEASLPDTTLGHPPLLVRVRTVVRRLLRKDPNEPVTSRLEQFEGAVRRQAARLDGPLANDVVFSGLLRAPLYSALLGEAYYLLDQYGSSSDAAEWAASIVQPPPGFATELRRWVEDRVALVEAKPDAPGRIAHDLATLRHLGGWAPRRTCASMWWAMRNVYDPIARRAVRALFDGMDTRPTNLATATIAARDLLWDTRRRERYGAAALRSCPETLRTDDLGFLLKSMKDPVVLERLANRQNLGTGTRSAALLSLLRIKGADTTPILDRIRELSLEVGDAESGGFLLVLVEALDGIGRHADADREIEEWLRCRGQGAGLMGAEVLAVKAARLRKAGRLDEAWRAIGPATRTGKESCLLEAGNILMAQGHYDAALEVANDTIGRYVNSYGGFVLGAEALWRLGRPAEAAKRLADALKERSPFAWTDDVGPAFARAFGSAQPADVDRAVQELANAKVTPERVRNIGVGVGRSGNHELAFRVIASIGGASDDERSAVLFAYAELQAAKGKRVALEWFKSRMPPLDDPAVNWAYQHGDDELIWEYVDPTPGRVNQDKLHVLRAAACIRAAQPDAARREAVLQYAHKVGADGWGAIYPKFLLGETDETALLASITGRDDACTAAWAIGARKVGEGKFAEANDWFEIAMETGRQQLPPIAFAYDVLAKWTEAEEPLDALAVERVSF